MANTKDNMDRCGIAWFKFDEASGNSLDSKGSFVGTNNNTTVVAGVSGNARSFNGTTSFIQFNNKVIPLGKKSIRFKFKGTTTNPYVVATTNGSSGVSGFRVAISATAITTQFVQGTVIQNHVYNTNLLDNVWHDILITWDGTTNANAVKMYIDDMLTPKHTGTNSVTETTAYAYNLTLFRQPEFAGNFGTGAIDELEIYNDVISVAPDKTLVFHNGVYKYYTTSWQTIGATVTENDYITKGMDDISIIPESAWGELTGNIEFCYWTDHQPKTEVSFNIETESFTLADELKDQTIKIIEYTDNPVQEESSVTIETYEPFTIYDELGDNAEILYYTDGPTKNSAQLEITANHSLLDELSGDVEVVTWTNAYDEGIQMGYDLNALPQAQFIASEYDYDLFGELQSIITNIADTPAPDGILRFLLSFDSGVTWESYRYSEWRAVNVSVVGNIKLHGMTATDVHRIPSEVLQEKTPERKVRIGYYLEERKHREEEMKIDSVKIVSLAPVNDVKFNDLAFYILNTTATINVQFAGNKITGSVTDEDLGKVKYRILLNGEPYFPSDGKFSAFQQSPLNINVVIDDRLIRFGEQNSLVVEFQDYWGEADSWSTNFIGTHSGIVFTDEKGSFYTTAFGEVLKYLDFGEIIAGQTTLDQKVLLKNQIGYDVTNVKIRAIQPKEAGVTIELSKTQSPFIAESVLDFTEELIVDDHFEFFVRISTQLTADTTPNGTFEIRVTADKVV